MNFLFPPSTREIQFGRCLDGWRLERSNRLYPEALETSQQTTQLTILVCYPVCVGTCQVQFFRML